MKIDSVDEKIIEMLRKNSRIAVTDIADSLKLTEGAVRYRIKRLVNDKVIKKFTIVSESQPSVLIAVKTEAKTDAKKISSNVMEIDGIEKIYETAGDIDMMVLARVPYQNLNGVINSLRKIPGITSTSSYLILSEKD